MFCPNCGSEDHQKSQYCRACGADLRSVRQGLEKPELVMASIMSARDEIGRAIAARIREVREAGDLKLIEQLLPEVEKFFETPEERRLRRIRAGVIMAMCGLGGTLFFFLLSQKESDLLFMTMAGVALFLIGMGIILNGLLFTVPKEKSRERHLDSVRDEVERNVGSANTREELYTVRQAGIPVSSVTEHTTHKLAGSEPSLLPKAGSGLKQSE